jgi:hypothetical protein
MKPTLFLTALLALGALATVPSGSAHTIDPIFPKCQTVYDFPDLGWEVCVDPRDPDCTVYEHRTTLVGREKDCLYPDAEASSTAAVGPPDLSQWPKCFPAAVGQLCFSPYWPGCNLWIVWTAIPAQPTCLYRSDPGPLAAGAGAETQAPPCYEVYSETHLAGPYWLVRRNSCSAQVYQCPDGYDPPAPPCEEVRILEAGSTSSAREPMCLQYYRETEVGPVRHVQRDSCHSETYVCGETAREFTDVDLTNPDHAALQDCVRDSLDDYVAWP